VQPASSGVALPDRHAPAILAWKVVGITSLALGGIAFLGFIALMFVAMYGGSVGVATGVLFVAALLIVLGIVGVVVVYQQQTAQRTELADALTRAGHPGVDALRLQRGLPAPSPQNLELRLRKERDDSGAQWLLVDAYSYATPPRA
jgi:Flp pilus assembly protein TadB